LLKLRASTQGVTRGDYHGLEHLGPENYKELNELSENFREMGAAVMERETFLRASEERYRSLIAGMGEGLLIIDQGGRIIDCNQVAEQIFSLSRREIVDQEVLFKSWRTIGEDGEPFPADKHPFSQTLLEGVDINNQMMGLCAPDGREIWLQVNSRPQQSLHGDVHAAIITFADVTSLKVAEASLRSSKQRYQELFQQFSAVLDGITDRIDLLTPDLKVVWSNRSGTLTKENGNRDFRRGYRYTSYGRDTHCPDCPVVCCFASGRREIGEIVDGQGQSWNLRAFPVKGDGVVTQVVLIAEDVTRQRESEKQSVRAGQLAALGELAAGVAHEINNPISGVINYAQLICNRADVNSREHDLAGRIIKEGDRIATIVKELLIFAREESSEIHVVSIREALAEALTLCESPLRKEGVNLRIDLPPDLPRVESRSHQIQQLFLNLISNARHALSEKYPESHDDKILLISGCAMTIDERPGVRLKVRDHGTGIPVELLERVMNPFVTTKPAGVGTGLGLSISFEIAKKHGGTLSIASQYGAWTEVTIDLPAYARSGDLDRTMP
jgi:PAS domain S-box-containing protein